MIKRIHIKNFILIDDISVDFTSGLNVITGETGSGKSILINAIDFAFGAKSSKAVIKTGTDKSLIELTISVQHDLSDFYDKYGIEDWADELVISREITSQSSRSRVNGTLVNIDVIKSLRELVLDIHSQHQTYSFIQPNKHIYLLDLYSKDSYGDLLVEYKALWREYQQALLDLKEAEKLNEFTENQIDFLKFQIEEISSANIDDINEYEHLQNELNVLTNSEKLKEYVSGAFWTLSEDDNSAMSTLLRVKNFISKAASYDEKLSDIENTIIECCDSLKDISYELNSYASKLEFDEARINDIQERLSVLDKLKRKYGNTLEDVLYTLDKLSDEFQKIEKSNELVESLNMRVTDLHSKLEVIAAKLSECRKLSAESLSKEVVSVLTDLELPKSKFEIVVKSSELSSTGADSVEFLISTNISEDVKPLSKVASGGEISRVMLAIKSIFAKNDEIDTVIFDEIDTGISGKASIAVADKISSLSKYIQVILITHQAIIASKADNHIYVSKTQNDTTNINIKILQQDERLKALAELASGEVNTESLDFARSLVQ